MYMCLHECECVFDIKVLPNSIGTVHTAEKKKCQNTKEYVHVLAKINVNSRCTLILCVLFIHTIKYRSTRYLQLLP